MSQSKMVRINCSISGEPARILLELKRRGLARSNRDAIVQALLAFNEKIVERDLKEAQLRSLRGMEDDK